MKKETWIYIGIAASVAGLAWKFWDKITNFNKGTAFEGTGAIGTLGNATNQLLGGAPAAIGETLSRWTYDLLNSDDNDNVSVTPFNVTYPDGVKRPVYPNEISKSGTFLATTKYGANPYAGKTLTIYVDATGKKYAK
jgi:hypothetical protein